MNIASNVNLKLIGQIPNVTNYATLSHFHDENFISKYGIVEVDMNKLKGNILSVCIRQLMHYLTSSIRENSFALQKRSLSNCEEPL